MFENDSQELENDVLILYVLGQFDISITEKSLTEIILSPGLVNYFSFQSSLTRLLKDKLINILTDTDGINMYSITEEGLGILATLEGSISPAVRKHVRRISCKGKKQNIKRNEHKRISVYRQ